MSHFSAKPRPAFTLAEMLIAFAILGMIATFTIPKVLQSQQDIKYSAMAKEAAGMIAGAYDAYRMSKTPVAATSPKDLTPYMNFVKADTDGTVVDDEWTLTGSYTCGTSNIACLALHNGAYLYYRTTQCFNGTNPTNAFWFAFDPDGKLTADGSASSPGKNGRLTTRAGLAASTDSCAGAYGPQPRNPPWFSWN
jgi:prepilin-type N-terminal cleavage/methylation domain-containing protein